MRRSGDCASGEPTCLSTPVVRTTPTPGQREVGSGLRCGQTEPRIPPSHSDWLGVARLSTNGKAFLRGAEALWPWQVLRPQACGAYRAPPPPPPVPEQMRSLQPRSLYIGPTGDWCCWGRRAGGPSVCLHQLVPGPSWTSVSSLVKTDVSD